MNSKGSIITRHKTLIVFLLIVGGVVVLKMTNMGEALTLANMQNSATALKNQVQAHYISSILIFIASYVFLNLWLPTAAMLTLLAGYLFGAIPATLYVITAAILGALLGFWISRHIMGNWVQRKWHRQLVGLNKEIEKQGYIYLVFVRMIPLIPYNLINFLIGLTKVPPKTVAWTTALGSLPGILIFTYAGQQFMTIKSVDDVLTPETIIAFCLLAVFAVTGILIKIGMSRKHNTNAEGSKKDNA